MIQQPDSIESRMRCTQGIDVQFLDGCTALALHGVSGCLAKTCDCGLGGADTSSRCPLPALQQQGQASTCQLLFSTCHRSAASPSCCQSHTADRKGTCWAVTGADVVVADSHHVAALRAWQRLHAYLLHKQARMRTSEGGVCMSVHGTMCGRQPPA